MIISKKEVAHTAALSRLKLSEKEIEKFSRELTAILGYIGKLKELDTDKVEAGLKASGWENKVRPDKVLAFKDEKKILKNAPKTSTNFIEVKGVFK
ncbi:MAG: Asp-tRNA(Asn)/Glu-tRNA(Gln) amidotransferase subunit GatC [Patescibacteria group bacterium]